MRFAQAIENVHLAFKNAHVWCIFFREICYKKKRQGSTDHTLTDLCHQSIIHNSIAFGEVLPIQVIFAPLQCSLPKKMLRSRVATDIPPVYNPNMVRRYFRPTP